MTTFFNSFRLITTATKIIQSLRKFQQLAPPTPTLTPTPTPPPSPPPSTALDFDQRTTTEAAEKNPQIVAYPAARQHHWDWTMITLSTAIEIALKAIKINSQDPSTFHLFSLLILFAFAALFVSQFISSILPVTTNVLDCVGLFFAGASFCYAISITIPPSLKFITWTVFSISLLVIGFLSHYF